MHVLDVASCTTPFNNLHRFTMVHSVFAHGFNIATPASTRDQGAEDPRVPLLWVDTSSKELIVPSSIRLQNSLGSTGLVHGTPVSYDPNSHSFVIGGTLKLNMASAAVIDTKLPDASLPLTHPDYADILELGLSNAHNVTERVSPVAHTPITARVTHHLTELIHALVTDNAAGAREHVNMLIGYGYGLTPSGDDALLGSYVFMRVHHPRLAARIKPLIQERLHKTTDVSASYLTLALDGHVALQLHDVIAGFSGVRDDVALAELLSTGHSSGEDIVRGIHLTARILTGTLGSVEG